MGFLLLTVTTLSKVTAVLFIAVTFAAACATDTDSSSGQTDGGFTSVAIFGADTQQSHIYTEEDVFRCMNDEGFEYKVKPFEKPKEFDSREIREERGFGYSLGAAFQDSEESLETDDDTFPDSVLSEEDKAAYSTKELECQEDAQENLNALVTEFVAQLDPQEKELYDSIATFEHPDLVEAQNKWAECMNDKGYDHSSPFTMLEFALESFTDAASLDEEIALSLADWDCSKSPEVSELQDSAHDELDSQVQDDFAEEIKDA